MTVTIYLLVGIASVLVIEGAVYAVAPGPMKRLVSAVTELQTSKLRSAGVVSLIVGVGMFFLLTRFGPL